LFSFEPGVIIWTVISFLIVLVIINKLAYPPINKILEERKNLIDFSLSEAKKNQESANTLLAQADEKIRNINNEGHKIISEAKGKAKNIEKEYEARALSEYAKLRSKKKEELNEIEKKFFQATELKLTQTVVQACQKILSLDLTAEQKEQFILHRIDELKEIKNL
jgi:F-type H+-transporting ATPase subunit b